MTSTADVRPGTVPAWAIRYAYDGEEWLVLAQGEGFTHPCRGEGEGWAVLSTTGFKDCLYCGFPVAIDRGTAATDPWFSPHDDLAEAHAAFEAIEAEWIRRER